MQVVGRHLDLTEPIKDYINAAVETLDKYGLDIISIRAIISSEEKKGKHGVSIEFTINLPHKNTIVIKQRDKDLYAAIDIAMGRAHKVLARHHEKVVDHHKHAGIEQTTYEHLNMDADSGEEDEIVPMDLELHKPLEIEEALNMLKDSDQQFLIFNDHENKTRVIHKRNDSKFGLY
jgi:putative sigma-54 modulation protein